MVYGPKLCQETAAIPAWPLRCHSVLMFLSPPAAAEGGWDDLQGSSGILRPPRILHGCLTLLPGQRVPAGRLVLRLRRGLLQQRHVHDPPPAMRPALGTR